MNMLMRRIALSCLVVLAWVCLLTGRAEAALPRRDLLVELRQVVDGREGAEEPLAYSVATAAPGDNLVAQQVRVQNGEKAQLRITQSTPMQWVQSAAAQSTALTTDSASVTQKSGAITQANSTVESGQILVLTPRWPGGSKPVQVAIDLQTAAVDGRTGADLPATSRRQVATTVSAPLRQWVTIATSGGGTASGTYSSAGAADARRLIQIRVSPQ